jgi:hypothetical protein
MKKHLLYSLIAATGLSLASCDDFLDDNRWPLDSQTNNPAYWNNEVNVEAQINTLYGYYLGYGNGSSWTNDFYYRALSDDQCAEIQSGSGVVFSTWAYQYAPETNSTWDNNYTYIRKFNTIINNVKASTLPEKVKNNFMAIGRLNRANKYWDLVRCFGDVPLVMTVLDVNSPELYGARTNRNVVMDTVLADLNFAVNNIDQINNKIEFSKDMANAMKAEICLFEASYAKYHQNDEARANKFFNEVVNACQEIMSSNRYSVCSDYRSLYNSVFTADASRGFVALSDNPEVIFIKNYSLGTLGHSMVKYLSSNTTISGMTKDAFDAYLFVDGKPLATTSENTDDAAVLDANGYASIEHVFAARDKRLEATIDPYLAFNGCTWKRDNSDDLASVTGYTIRKFINPGMTYNECTLDGSNFTCAPIYWLAPVLLSYAEAKAELGTLTDADLDASINKLYTRAGLPNQTVASLSSINDPANNMNVSSLLWEIRRCRRCELVFDRYTRYWDLIRWKQLELIGTNTNPSANIYMGANVSKLPAEKLSGVQVTDGYINAAKTTAGTSTRIFTEREYFYPIGTKQLVYNPNLTQNPGWE